MGDLYIKPLCFDDIARIDGEEAAQRIWQERGGTGKYVPGAVATAGVSIGRPEYKEGNWVSR